MWSADFQRGSRVSQLRGESRMSGREVGGGLTERGWEKLLLLDDRFRGSRRLPGRKNTAGREIARNNRMRSNVCARAMLTTPDGRKKNDTRSSQKVASRSRWRESRRMSCSLWKGGPAYIRGRSNVTSSVPFRNHEADSMWW